ncbi:hypothetical protein [Shewanella sp.]|uniref:hypothetical protein n=1 Tax=Shewanella sp. TaxID=50422 RepID=UPI003A96EC86
MNNTVTKIKAAVDDITGSKIKTIVAKQPLNDNGPLKPSVSLSEMSNKYDIEKKQDIPHD